MNLIRWIGIEAQRDVDVVVGKVGIAGNHNLAIGAVSRRKHIIRSYQFVAVRIDPDESDAADFGTRAFVDKGKFEDTLKILK